MDKGTVDFWENVYFTFLPDEMKDFTGLSARVEQWLSDESRNIREKHGPCEIADWMLRQGHGPELNQLESSFPSITRQSLFLIAYGVFEFRLINVVGLLLEPQLTLKLDDLYGGGLLRVEKYLKKVAGIDMPCGIFDTDDLRTFNLARNAIAHNCGNLHEERVAHAHQCLARSPRLQNLMVVSEYGRIDLMSGFLPHFVSEAEETYKQLATGIRKTGFFDDDTATEG